MIRLRWQFLEVGLRALMDPSPLNFQTTDDGTFAAAFDPATVRTKQKIPPLRDPHTVLDDLPHTAIARLAPNCSQASRILASR
jgi:hypothetical protein